MTPQVPDPRPNENGDDDDREGLDFLAATIDKVAADLPPPSLALPTLAPERWRQEPGRAPLLPPARTRRRRWQNVLGWAAAASLFLLVYPAYLGLVKLPDAQHELATLRAAQGEKVQVDWISPAREGTRAAETPAPIGLDLPAIGQKVFLLELPASVAAAVREGARLELIGEDGKTLVRELSSLEVQLQLAQEFALPFLLRHGELDAGRYRLRLLDGPGREWLQVELEMRDNSGR